MSFVKVKFTQVKVFLRVDLHEKIKRLGFRAGRLAVTKFWREAI
jgi:hypothetical protein